LLAASAAFAPSFAGECAPVDALAAELVLFAALRPLVACLAASLSPGCGPPHGRSTGLAKKRAGEPSLALAGAVRASAVAQAQRHQATLVAAARKLARTSLIF
jgi:hypothetical protein